MEEDNLFFQDDFYFQDDLIFQIGPVILVIIFIYYCNQWFFIYYF